MYVYIYTHIHVYRNYFGLFGAPGYGSTPAASFRLPTRGREPYRVAAAGGIRMAFSQLGVLLVGLLMLRALLFGVHIKARGLLETLMQVFNRSLGLRGVSI